MAFSLKLEYMVPGGKETRGRRLKNEKSRRLMPGEEKADEFFFLCCCLFFFSTPVLLSRPTAAARARYSGEGDADARRKKAALVVVLSQRRNAREETILCCEAISFFPPWSHWPPPPPTSKGKNRTEASERNVSASLVLSGGSLSSPRQPWRTPRSSTSRTLSRVRRLFCSQLVQCRSDIFFLPLQTPSQPLSSPSPLSFSSSRHRPRPSRAQ